MTHNSLRALVFCPTPMGIFEQSLALQERGLLETMAVNFYANLAALPLRWVPQSKLRQKLQRRFHPALDVRRVRSHPLPTVGQMLGHRLRWGGRSFNEWVFWHNDQFDRWVADQLPRLGNLAFGYESSSLHTFRRAKALGVPCVLYQPIACAETALELLGEEARRQPALAATLRYNEFSEAELARRREERALADMILCATRFTKQSLIEQGVDASKIYVEPYGVDQQQFEPSQDKFAEFSVIWASSYTQTKGISYLLEALAREPVPAIELKLAGYPFGPDAVAMYEDRIRVRRLGHLSRETLAHTMARCHVHVFPTLIEGFGRNIIEAMASGLPVIATAHCAAGDLIEDGVTGFVVPIRDVEAICERLRWIYDNPQTAAEMGRRARERVASLTQADYRRRFATRIEQAWQTATKPIETGTHETIH